MVDASSIKNRLQTKIFDGLGSTVFIESLDDTATSTNIYGETIKSYNSAVDVKAVPYNLISSRTLESFGDVKAGDVDVVFPEGTDVDYDYRVTYDGVQYLVTEIEKYPLQDSSLALLVRLAKIQ